jgi:hypothetical protein
MDMAMIGFPLSGQGADYSLGEGADAVTADDGHPLLQWCLFEVSKKPGHLRPRQLQVLVGFFVYRAAILAFRALLSGLKTRV